MLNGLLACSCDLHALRARVLDVLACSMNLELKSIHCSRSLCGKKDNQFDRKKKMETMKEEKELFFVRYYIIHWIDLNLLHYSCNIVDTYKNTRKTAIQGKLFELFLCHPSHKIYFYYFLIYLLFLLLFIKYFYTCKCFLWRNKPTYLPRLEKLVEISSCTSGLLLFGLCPIKASAQRTTNEYEY